MIRALALVSGLVLASHCLAMTGNELASRCSEGASPQDDAYCLGYFDGFVDGDLVGRYSAPRPIPASFCPPSTITLGQVRNVVLRYLKENPAQTHKMALELVADALKQAFPCRRP